MKIKQAQIISAYNAAEKISETARLSDSSLWELYHLRKVLREHSEFQTERENALRQKYTKFANEDGMISGDPYKAYLKELSELAGLEKEIDIGKFNIHVTEGMTIAQMEALEPFVEFAKPAE